MQKAHFTLFFVFVMALAARAQTEKGRWLIGAQVADISYQNYRSDIGFAFSGRLTPSLNYFIHNNLLIGMELPASLIASRMKYPQTSPTSQLERQLGLGPSVRYFMGKAALKPFVGLSYTYSRYVHKYNRDSTGRYQANSRGFRGNLAPTAGVAYFINRHIVLNAALAYNLYQDKWKNEVYGMTTPDVSGYNYTSKSLTFGIGFALLLGD